MSDASDGAERRYRRVLRLLPAGYRARWEEDMMTAYLDAGPSPGERLSVVRLAFRLRLNGSYVSPKGLVWYRVAHAMALLVLLYQAVAATVSFVLGASIELQYRYSVPAVDQGFFVWSRLLALFWVAAFACFVLGRFGVARVLVLLACAGGFGINAAITLSVGAGILLPRTLAATVQWAWLALSVAVVFVTPAGARASRRLWFGAYVIGSALVSTAVLPDVFALISYTPWIHFASLGDVVGGSLMVAMIVTLTRASRHRSPHWLLALALIGGGVGVVRLAKLGVQAWPVQRPTYASVLVLLIVTQVALAVVCAAVGLTGWVRVPTAAATPPGPASG